MKLKKCIKKGHPQKTRVTHKMYTPLRVDAFHRSRHSLFHFSKNQPRVTVMNLKKLLKEFLPLKAFFFPYYLLDSVNLNFLTCKCIRSFNHAPLRFFIYINFPTYRWPPCKVKSNLLLSFSLCLNTACGRKRN